MSVGETTTLRLVSTRFELDLSDYYKSKLTLTAIICGIHYYQQKFSIHLYRVTVLSDSWWEIWDMNSIVRSLAVVNDDRSSRYYIFWILLLAYQMRPWGWSRSSQPSFSSSRSMLRIVLSEGISSFGSWSRSRNSSDRKSPCSHASSTALEATWTARCSTIVITNSSIYLRTD